MAGSDILDDLRAQFPACEFIAFADLSAAMVLLTSARTQMPQERWDGLCAMAQDVLRGPASALALQSLGAPPQGMLKQAAIMNATECDVFLSAASAPDYALCAVGRADLCIADFAAAAGPVLDHLVQDD